MKLSFNSHKAVIAYCIANGLPDTEAALRQEVNFGEDVFNSATAQKYEGMLEKKWTSIARLQRKVPMFNHPKYLNFTHSVTSNEYFMIDNRT